MLNNPQDIAIADYDYPLPNERIAKFPLAQRDQSKLLIYKDGEIAESQFFHLPELLPHDAMLLFNNTKVIHARLFFRKQANTNGTPGALIEVFCLEPYNQPVAQTFEERQHCSWLCFIGNNKKWKEGPINSQFSISGSAHVPVGINPGSAHVPVGIQNSKFTLTASRKEAVGNAWVVDFDWDGGMSFAEVIEHAGVIPLPPYLHRDAEESDKERYQTVYADPEGSVAAPTAGLHFTDNVLDELRKKGITTEFITLHVGAGTFKPVSTDTIGEHEMHVEKVQISRDNIIHLLKQMRSRNTNAKTNNSQFISRPIIAVGTTTVRTLESVYWFGVQLEQNPNIEAMHVLQWEPYQNSEKTISVEQSYNNVLQWMDSHNTDILFGDTQLLIAPGYKYKVINGLITNFHQPKSTLLLLVSALIGNDWKRCYSYALDHGFRFLSYGDSCLFMND